MSDSSAEGIDPFHDRRFDRWVTVAAVATAGVGLTLIVGGDQANTTFANVTQIVAPLIATLVAWQAATRTSDASWRLGWALISASTLSWCIGQCIWTWYESVQGDAVPFPSLADVGYLLAPPLAIAGLLVFPSSPARLTARTRTLFDGLIVAGSVLFVSWVFVLGPSFDTSGESRLEWAISIAYPVFDVVLLTIVFVVLQRLPQVGQVALAFVAAGFATFAVADSSFAYTTLNELAPSPLANTAWVGGYLLIALGALHAAMHPVSARADEEDRPGRFVLLLPYLPLGAVLVTAAGSRVFSDDFEIDAAQFWIGIVLIALLLVRQAVVLVDNATLTDSLAQSMARLEHQALHDGLTGLPNRVLYNDRLQVALARVQRQPYLVGVMFIDLDHFKEVNDRLGHRAGDLVLMTAGDRIAQVLRSHDTVARFGGDEFLVLCDSLADRDEVLSIGRRICEAVAAPISVGDSSVTVTCSVGIVLTNRGDDNGEELVRLADHVMYEVKAAGRNDVLLDDRCVPTPPTF